MILQLLPYAPGIAAAGPFPPGGAEQAGISGKKQGLEAAWSFASSELLGHATWKARFSGLITRLRRGGIPEKAPKYS